MLGITLGYGLLTLLGVSCLIIIAISDQENK